MKKILLVAIMIPLLFSCGKEETPKSNSNIIEYNEDSTSETNNSKPVETVDHIVIKANEDMTFDKVDFTVKTGQEITLLLVNNGTSPKEAMGHNVVVLNKDADANSFAFAASSASDNEYIPKDKEGDIIVHTKLLGPKESDQVKFTINEPGTYDFICSFPGHAATMKGKIKAIN